MFCCGNTDNEMSTGRFCLVRWRGIEVSPSRAKVRNARAWKTELAGVHWKPTRACCDDKTRRRLRRRRRAWLFWAADHVGVSRRRWCIGLRRSAVAWMMGVFRRRPVLYRWAFGCAENQAGPAAGAAVFCVAYGLLTLFIRTARWWNTNDDILWRFARVELYGYWNDLTGTENLRRPGECLGSSSKSG